VSNPTSIRLEDADLERVKQLAAATRRKQSDLLRYALELGLEAIERETKVNRATEGLDQ
jgi:predicted transcriptional regulator